MVKDMLKYARPLNLRLSPTDVNGIIQESMAIVEAMAGKSRWASTARVSSEIFPRFI